MSYTKLLIIFFVIIFSSSKLTASDTLISKLQDGGKIIIIRHAYAPGSGDPDNFLINDCSTQRNLNKIGIQQSKRIGNFFKKNKIPIEIVLSSEWCRCKDTALYAFHDFKTISFLNSFYDNKFLKNKVKQMNELKEYITKWKADKNLILITHYVVINELLNISSNSGEMIIFDQKFNVIGKLESKL